MTTAQTKGGPDVGQLRLDELPQTTFPGGRSQAFRIFFSPEVHRQVWRHATENIAVEICGVLVGKWARDPDGPFVLISESIRGEAATNKFAEVTFTHDTWAKINHEMDSRFSSLSIVGWYHSHPNFGVFLSDRDRFIQEHFFSGAGQLAYVVDPVRKTEGAFIWQTGKPTLAPHYWVGDRVQVGTPAGSEESASAVSSPNPAGGKSETPAGAAARDAGGWLPILSHVALFVAVFLVGFLLAPRLNDIERARVAHDALARGYFAHRSPGLPDDLGQVAGELGAAADDIKKLSQEHLKLLEDPKDATARWNEVYGHLAKAARGLIQLQNTYALTPEEMAFLRSLTESKSRGATDSAKSKDDKAKPKEHEDPDKKGSGS
jgi:proteasome lid subunit RPN8/RPN11